MKLALVSTKQEGVESPTSNPFGLISLATYARDKGGFNDIKIIDLNFSEPDEVAKYKPDLIGISAMTVDYGKAISLAEHFRNTTEVPIILGGVHISTLPASFKPVFDVGVVGEGEETLLELLRLFENKGEFNPKDLESIMGVVYRSDEWLKQTPRRPLIEPLDIIPIPDRDYMDPKYFEPTLIFYQNQVVPKAHMMTSRGCPYKCVFCSTSKFWSKIRFHSAEHVVEEIKYLHNKYGVKHISIEDDLFTVNLDRLEEIKKGLAREGLLGEVTFNCQPRANTISERTCQIMRDLNVKTLGFGFESGCEKTLKYLKGGSVTVQQNKEAVKMCVKYGFNVTGSLIFGSPGETIPDMEETLKFIDFLHEAGAANVWNFVMTPFPGTQMWEIAKQRGKVSDDMDWNKLSHHNISGPLLLDDNIPISEFESIVKTANEKAFKLGKKEKWRELIKLRITQNPLGVFRLALKNPKKAVKYLFKGG
ncbi:MAG: radical SAM protein [Candidatus Altiarchaeota archaeon]|nr:radical SAM protein [Candidatus Altiarchaeota archaeon]